MRELILLPKDALDLTVDIQCTAFQAGVWKVLRKIPLGETVSYSQLAERIGRRTAVRAVASACARNKVAWLIPCHRAVGVDGRVAGYRWATDASCACVSTSRALWQAMLKLTACVYGTGPFFRGRARPGDDFYIDTSLEYSITTRWVLAMDVLYSHNDSSHATGIDNPSGPAASPMPVSMHSGPSDTVGYAPAVEYSWMPNIGVLLGMCVLAGGHNMHRSVTPVITINYVH
ncbi:MAG: methylated-DNA--[protein]-cysteine S-methyltransferase [Rhodanobacter sp.]